MRPSSLGILERRLTDHITFSSDTKMTTVEAMPRQARIDFDSMPPALLRRLAEAAKRRRPGRSLAMDPDERPLFPIPQIGPVAPTKFDQASEDSVFVGYESDSGSPWSPLDLA